MAALSSATVPAHTIAWLNVSGTTVVYGNPTNGSLNIGNSSLLEIHLAGVSSVAIGDFSPLLSSAPAGVAGQSINFGLNAPTSDDAVLITLQVEGLPSGWTLSGAQQVSGNTWTLPASGMQFLTVTAPAAFSGAVLLNVTETWTESDGSVVATTVADNVEVYPTGSPIFAISGNDYLTGSSSKDLFVFSQPIGNDVIYSFDASQDQIDLIGYAGFTNFGDVNNHLTTDANGNAVITLADGQSITLYGVAAVSLSADNFVFDPTPVTNIAGTMTIGDGALLPLSGVINNTGTIALDSAGSTTTLELIQYGITLKGGGQVVLSDSSANFISGTLASVTLTNVDNTISGAGQLGAGQMTLVNSGTIIANGTNALVIDTGSNVVINSGTLEATGNGGLIVNSDISNSGLIWSYGGNITINGTVTGTGSALITGSSTLEFAAASSVNVTFDGDGFGMLLLDNPTAYTGQIFGFTGTDAQHSDLIDLKGITFDDGTSWTYYDNSGLNTGGTLTVYETINDVTTAVDSIAFGDGEYTTANFKLMSDGNGGTLIADPPAEPGTATIDLDASSETAAISQLSECCPISGNSWISISGAYSLGAIIAAAAQTSNGAAIVSVVLHGLETWFDLLINELGACRVCRKLRNP